ncbi:AAA family ATPase [Paracoccus saliphilus]|uniref:AAA family ATPase n=1 Tax=Paracoccus saliphilus TaxID=405559 RepID=A0AA45W7M0_9RHOB|nr:AAA family ATPase [Paracoccus saliphilus]WCR04757.1 AAA family ATPase [Paracoccus saliphilus]SIT10995.1 ATPase/GTPase, AAA15 family [Paracoccus saliphilus]
MGSNYFFHSLDVKNFRIFKSLEINELKGINIFSGINGSGKSAILETLFLSIDLANPICLIRPFNWRGIPLSGDDLKILLPNIHDEAQIRVETKHGPLEIIMNYGKPDDDLKVSISTNVSNEAKAALNQLNAQAVDGINLSAKYGENSTGKLHMFSTQAGENINTTSANYGTAFTSTGVYLSQFAPSHPREISDRFSKLVKMGKKDKFIEYLRILNPNISDIIVLQDANNAQLYVSTLGEMFTPLALMGGGLRALAEIVSSVMISHGGVVFIDELDSALHFSIIPKLWEILAEISLTEEVQLFAITHSRESIRATATGVDNAKRSSDYQYIRVDEFDEFHKCVTYSTDEVHSALDLNVEIR